MSLVHPGDRVAKFVHRRKIVQADKLLYLLEGIQQAKGYWQERLQSRRNAVLAFLERYGLQPKDVLGILGILIFIAVLFSLINRL